MIVRRKRIAALMAGVDREYQQAFTCGMVRAGKEKDVDLCVFNCQGQPDGSERNDRGERAIFDLPELSDFDGVVLLMATIPTAACREQLREKLSCCPNIPLVTIDSKTDNSIRIDFEDQNSVREIMTHLLEEHHIRNAAFVTGPEESSVAMRRYEACMQVLAEHGITVHDADVIEGSWVRESGYQAAEKLLSGKRPLPDAIICGNDDMAFGVIERLKEAGLHVPEDVKITGFDALREAEGRGLTTVRRPVFEAGQKAVELLTEWFETGRPDVEVVRLPTQVVYGHSCGCTLDGMRATAYVRLLSDERRMVEWTLRQAASYFGALSGVSGREDAGAQINQFAKTMNLPLLYVCVDPAFPSTALNTRGTSYPREMQLLAGWKDRRPETQQRFDTRKLLPLLEEERAEPLALVFSPLYALDMNLGYTVCDVMHANGYAYYSLLTLLAGALTSLSLQTTIRAYAAVLENRSTHDPMTGLYNRLGFEQNVPRVFEKAKREGRCFAVVSCDMDGMKAINDRYGHLTGDKAIARMGRALQSLERCGLMCIHISGDEFLAVGTVADTRAAQDLLPTLRDGIDHLNRNDPWLCDIGASMGVYAAIPKPNDQLNDYLMYADRRMYEEKAKHHSEG